MHENGTESIENRKIDKLIYSTKKVKEIVFDGL